MRATRAATLNRLNELRAAGVPIPPEATAKEEHVQAVQERAREAARAFHGWFESVDGRRALQFLRENFAEGELFHPDPLVMARLVGMRDLVLFIEDAVEKGQKNQLVTEPTPDG